MLKMRYILIIEKIKNMLPLDILKYLSNFLSIKEIISFFTICNKMIKLLRHIPLDLSNFILNTEKSIFIKERYNLIGFNINTNSLTYSIPDWINTTITKLNFNNNNLGLTQTNLSLFANCIKLISLQLKCCILSSNKDFVLPSLKSLTLSILKLNTTLTVFPHLEYLSFRNCSRTTDLNFLFSLTSLIYLDVSNNRGLSNIDGLKFCPLLKTVLLNDCSCLITSDNWELHNPNIEELSFSVSSISQINIANLPHLSKLTLSLFEDLTFPLLSTSLTGLAINCHNVGIKIPDLSFLSNLSELYFNSGTFRRDFTLPALLSLRLLSFYDCNYLTIDISNLNLTAFIVKFDICITNIIGLENNFDLENITVESCKYIETLSLGSKLALKKLQIEKCMNFKRLILYDCPSLEVLTLHQLPIQCDISGISTTNKLKELTITECRQLEAKIRLPLTCINRIIMFSSGVKVIK